MRFHTMGLAFAAALMLAGCATAGASDPVAFTAAPVPSGGTAISAGAQKALYAAEAAYNVPAQAYVAANKSGLLSVAVKARAKPMLQTAYSALKLARSAAATGDSIGVLLHANEVQTQAGAINAILPAQ